MKLVLDLGHAGELLLPLVGKGALRDGLEVADVLARARLLRGEAAGAHARVVAQAALVQVRVVQRLGHRDPLLGVQRQHLQAGDRLSFRTHSTESDM